jgi:two-component system sensor histidine kinase QseC
MILEFDASLTARLYALASLVEFEEGRIEFDLAREPMPEFGLDDQFYYFELRGNDASILERSAPLQDSPLAVHTSLGAKVKTWDIRLPNGRAARAAGMKFTPMAEPQSDQDDLNLRKSTLGEPFPVTLIVAVDRSSLDESFKAMLKSWAIVMSAVPVVAALMVGALIRRGLRPLSDLASRAEGMNPALLNERFEPAPLPSELRPIAVQLNNLLNRIAGTLERERRFTDDVAHELRTPIAELRSMAELALRWPNDAETALKLNDDVLHIALRMERMINLLLQLRRLESGLLASEHSHIDFSALIKDAWKSFEGDASRRGLRVVLDIPSEHFAYSDESALKQIFVNLMANAVEYAPLGSDLELRLSEEHGASVFHISNPKGDLTHEDLEYLTEPFWRKDSSRTGSDHSGLGLALASGYARLIGTRLELAITADGRFVVSVRLLTMRAHT